MSTSPNDSNAEAWALGYTSGHSRAMRLMSDEPEVKPGTNPYPTRPRGRHSMRDDTTGPPGTVQATCTCGIMWEVRFNDSELSRLRAVISAHTKANPGHVAGVDDGSS